MTQQKVLNFNSKLGGSKEFRDSSGWLEKFKNRHGIRQLSIAGEKLSSDSEAGNSFIAELQELIVKEKLTADQICNCDETVLYRRALRRKSLAVENEAVALGRKKMKDRVSILGYANASGSHRVKLTLVGKSKKPRCFKKINKTTLPVHYMHQESAWVNSSLFRNGFMIASFHKISTDERWRNHRPKVRKPNSDDDNSESDEDEVIETSKISNSDAFECFAKGLLWLEQQTDSDSTELMLLKQLRDRADERRQSCLRQSELPYKSISGHGKGNGRKAEIPEEAQRRGRRTRGGAQAQTSTPAEDKERLREASFGGIQRR
ncbi:Jerky -like [Araneus ventricosus]|uniref:Jerky-like n=1 Tax=Araneus ventricosus TaxID=182803 RepID=A0A4Y2CCU3_ARAVE|nr:Jerky -like [Araneus ventricosus]